MSAKDKKSYQSSRLYYRKKDHKDIYYYNPKSPDYMKSPMFHSAVYLSGIGVHRDGLYWRKLFPDRYFKSRYEGDNLCYVDPPTYCGFQGTFTYLADTMNAEFRAANYGLNPYYVTSYDGRCYKRFINSKGIAIDRPTKFRGTRNYVVCDDWGGTTFYKISFKKDPNALSDTDPYIVDTVTTIRPEVNENSFLFYGGYPCDTSVVVFQVDRTNEQACKVYNTDTDECTEIKIPSGSKYRYLFGYSELLVANGRTFIPGNMSGTGQPFIHEVTDGVIGNLYMLPLLPITNTGRGNVHLGLKYNNGTYYLYETFYCNNGDDYGNAVFTSTDLISFTRVDIPRRLYIKNIYNPSETNYVDLTVTSLTDSHIFYSHNIHSIQDAGQLYENNRKIFDTYDMVFRVSTGYGSTKGLHIYLDNPTFQESDSNFYFSGSQVGSSDYTYDAMWKQYYKK